MNQGFRVTRRHALSRIGVLTLLGKYQLSSAFACESEVRAITASYLIDTFPARCLTSLCKLLAPSILVDAHYQRAAARFLAQAELHTDCRQALSMLLASIPAGVDPRAHIAMRAQHFKQKLAAPEFQPLRTISLNEIYGAPVPGSSDRSSL